MTSPDPEDRIPPYSPYSMPEAIRDGMESFREGMDELGSGLARMGLWIGLGLVCAVWAWKGLFTP